MESLAHSDDREPRFHAPPVPLTADGRPRRVGVEVEFIGLPVRAAADALAAAFGGLVREEDAHAWHLEASAIGDLTVELDVQHVHPHRAQQHPLPRLSPPASARLGAALSPFVPRELITAPLRLDALHRVDHAVGVLREAGARGRGITPFGALGLHFNIALPDLGPHTLACLLKAFLVLEPQLRDDTHPDVVARLFAPPAYPPAYVEKVLSPDYWPDEEALAEDYLADNPTRRRSLDLLPLLLHRDPEGIAPRLTDKVGKREVLHYRLPLACVGEPGWSVAADWNRWVAVERLAADPAALDAACRTALAGRPVLAADV